MGIRAIAQLPRRRQNTLAGLLGNLRVTGQSKGDQLPGDTQLASDLFLCDHGLFIYMRLRPSPTRHI